MDKMTNIDSNLHHLPRLLSMTVYFSNKKISVVFYDWDTLLEFPPTVFSSLCLSLQGVNRFSSALLMLSPMRGHLVFIKVMSFSLHSFLSQVSGFVVINTLPQKVAL